MDILSLLNTYRTIDAIPEDVLAEAGYIRTDGRIVRSDVLKQQKDKQFQQSNQLRAKDANAPFRKTPVAFLMNSIGFRRISGDRLKNLMIFIDKFEDITSIGETRMGGVIVPKEDNISFFETVCEEYFDGWFEEEGCYVRQLLFDTFGVSDVAFELTGFLKEADLTFPQSTWVEGEDEFFISPDSAQLLHERLERSRGRYCDVEIFQRSFDSSMNDDYVSGSARGDLRVALEETCPSFVEFTSARKCANNRGAVCELFSDMCEAEGLSDMSSVLKNTPAENLLEEMSTTTASILKRVSQQVDVLKLRVRKASTNEDLRNRLSRELKSATARLKRARRFLDGMQTYFQFPEVAVSFFNRTITELQKHLKHTEGDTEESLFVLDASIDEDRDSDAGAVSGDCTEGRPLPFLDPDVPVYNVKVFASDGEDHIGNVYLIVTVSDNNTPTWHLDAIQIPRSGVNWDEAVVALLESMGTEATKKKVSRITVNASAIHISNYDYIRDAVLRHAKNLGMLRVLVDVPYIPNLSLPTSHSSFQANGQALIVWEAPGI